MTGNVLVVDDDCLVRATLKLFLEKDGWTVTDARNGKQALAFVMSRAFDLIVTDLMMPEMEGIETIREIRRAGIETPILVISGGPTATKSSGRTLVHDFLRMSRDLGASETLRKPFTSREFLDKIHGLLKNSSN